MCHYKQLLRGRTKLAGEAGDVVSVKIDGHIFGKPVDAHGHELFERSVQLVRRETAKVLCVEGPRVKRVEEEDIE
jgi:hypothetical protein